MIKNGKLFGKINIFDFVVLLLVVVLVFGIGYKFLVLDRETDANTVEVTYELKVQSVRDVTRDAFRVGDKIYHYQLEDVIGTVEKVDYTEATDPMNTLEGEAIEAPVDNRYDVIVTVKATAVRHANGNLMIGKVKLAEGSRFRAATLLANCEAEVKNVQWK